MGRRKSREEEKEKCDSGRRGWEGERMIITKKEEREKECERAVEGERVIMSREDGKEKV